MPAVYLSHGAPPLADDPIWPGELSAWSAALVHADPEARDHDPHHVLADHRPGLAEPTKLR